MTQSHKIQRVLLAAATGALLSAGSAQAVDFLGNHIDDPVPGAMTPSLDSSRYQRIDILGSTIWAPKSGVEGPLRTETMDAEAMNAQRYEKLDILGNVQWVSKSR